MTKRFSLSLFLLLLLIPIVFLTSASWGGEVAPSLGLQLQSISDRDFIDAVILMKEKAKPEQFAGDSDARIEAVKSFCAASQSALVADLEKLKNNGTVQSYRGYWFFNGIGIKATKSVLEELAKRADVDQIISNGKYTVPPTEAHPAPPLTGLAPQDVQSNLVQIKADQVWALKDGSGNAIQGLGVKIADLDTGALLTHPDLSARIVKAATFDLAGTKTSDTCTDVNGHGTHTAGIMVGGAASGTSIGVAPQASLYVAKVFDDTNNASNQSVAGGAEWAIGEGAKVINMSLGGDTGQTDSFWFDQINQWDKLGIFIAASIGNSGPNASTTTSPGNVPNAMASGAVDSNDLVPSFSSRGPVIWNSVTFTKPDIVSPGVNIRSSNNSSTTLYITRTGTSMASPHTCGVAALVKQASPTSSGSSIRQILKSTADKVNTTTVSDYANTFGNGRLNALAAVNQVLTPDTTAPAITHASVEASEFGKSITLTATVVDDRTATPTVTIKYSSTGYTTREVTMTPKVTGSSIFQGTIPNTDTLENLRYFIQATDGAGNTRTALNGNNQPFSIAIQATSALTITDVLCAPSPFAPDGTKANGVHFTFFLSKASAVELRVYSLSGDIVHVITAAGTLSFNDIVWSGVTDSGSTISNGVYIYQIITRSGGETAVGRSKLIVLR